MTANKRTLAVRLGRARASWLYVVLWSLLRRRGLLAVERPCAGRTVAIPLAVAPADSAECAEVARSPVLAHRSAALWSESS